jgi:glutathione S-transferase
MRWENGRTQGESMDLVNEIDKRFADGRLQSDSSTVQDIVRQFSKIFPRARPSSRAAYLFQYNGEPLWESVFEQTLLDTDALIGSTEEDGPYFCGAEVTVADIAWAPFLERYRYQLPCLHDGLDPANPDEYPNLARWYEAMDNLPVYSCRVKGDGSSWRKVLTMAGFGNAGAPPQIQSNMDDLVSKEEQAAKESVDLECWTEFASTRPHAASSPHLEAATIITRNRKALVTDIVKQSGMPAHKGTGLPSSTEEADSTLQELVNLLIGGKETGSQEASVLAAFLDERMCVPRDMGFMTAATIKNLAISLR